MSNVRTVTIDGEEFRVEASIMAADVYATEFVGSLREPYRGVLEDDMLQTYGRAQQTVERYVKSDRKGNPVRDADGNLVPVEHGGVPARVPNPEYRGIDSMAMLRYVWAMATAAGSIDERWEEFAARMGHKPFVVREMASVYGTIIADLGEHETFRQPKGRADAFEPDEGREGDADAEDGGGDGVAE